MDQYTMNKALDAARGNMKAEGRIQPNEEDWLKAEEALVKLAEVEGGEERYRALREAFDAKVELREKLRKVGFLYPQEYQRYMEGESKVRELLYRQ